MTDQAYAARVVSVTEPPEWLEGVLALDKLLGRGIRGEGAHIEYRRVLDFLNDVHSLGFDNTIRYWAMERVERRGADAFEQRIPFARAVELVTERVNAYGCCAGYVEEGVKEGLLALQDEYELRWKGPR